jgi:preprotein translocase subunit SecG
MVVLLTVLHVIFCVFLILVILLQTGKGAGMGVAFGGASQTVFGPRGAGSFIGKATGIVAALFMVTSLTLAWFSSSKGTGIAEKAGALAEKRAGEVEEVDLTAAAAEPPLPEDGQSQEPEPQPASAAGDAGDAPEIAGDAGGGADAEEPPTDAAVEPVAPPEAETGDAAP